jgi:predicted transcriptional regulator
MTTASPHSPDPTKVATPDSAREDMVRFTGAGYTVVRHVFVQKHSGSDRSSTLALICKNKKKRALILYLMLLTLWRPDRGPLRSEVWLRLVTVTGGSLTWSHSSLSEAWSSLVDMGLVDRTRVRRMAHVVPRREDTKSDYERPNGKKKIDRYFQLPGAFWVEKWFDTLSLPGLCMLLLLLKETNDNDAEFHITHKQVEEWYGISASSAAKAFAELEGLGLVSVRRDQVKAGLALRGYTYHLYYRLNGDFSTAARSTARTAAKKGAQDRAAAMPKPTGSGRKKGPVKRSVSKPVRRGSPAKRSATRSAKGGLEKPRG